MATINTLPYLVLKNIFSQLPLTELARIHDVCPLWAWYQTEVMRQVTDLTLLLGANPHHRMNRRTFAHLNQRMLDTLVQPMFDKSHLRLPLLTTERVQYLMKHMPAISSLTVAIDDADCTTVDRLMFLIASWSASLRTLKLYMTFATSHLFFRNVERIPLKHMDLLSVIGSLPSLEHLTFDVDSALIDNRALPEVEMPILCRLREFFFASEGTSFGTLILNSLEKYATTNTRLEQMEIVNGNFNYNLPKFARSYPHLASKLKRLLQTSWINYVDFEETPLYVKETLALMPNLTQLNLNLFRTDFAQMLDAISPLKNIETLKVNLVSQVHLPLSSLNDIEPANLPSLPSVRNLIIWAYGSKPNDLDSTRWSHIFPNLESLQLFHFHIPLCAICQLPQSQEEMLKTMRASLETFTQCPKLQSIYTCEFEPYVRQNWVVVMVNQKKLILKV